MGVIPSLLGIYARNKRFQNQAKAYMQDKREDQRRRDDAITLSTLNRQPDTQSPFGNTQAYDPYRIFRQQYGE